MWISPQGLGTPGRQGGGTRPRSRARPHPQRPQELLQVQRPAAVTVPAPAHALRLGCVQHQPQLGQAPLELPCVQGPAPIPVHAAEKPGGQGAWLESDPGAGGLGRCEGTAHLARPWMPEAPRDRHWARSFSMVASTASMMGQGSLSCWMGERSGGAPARQPGYGPGAPAHSPGLRLSWSPGSRSACLQPALPSVGSVSCPAGLLLRDSTLETGRGPSCNSLCTGASWPSARPWGGMWRAERDRAVLLLPLLSTCCPARLLPALQCPGPGIKPGPGQGEGGGRGEGGHFLTTRRKGGPQPYGDQCPGWREARPNSCVTRGRSPPLSGLHQPPAPFHRASATAAEGSKFKGLEVTQAHIQQVVLTAGSYRHQR